MNAYVKAWQCIGCGKIEAPQTCIGVCQDRKVEFVYAFEHEEALAQLAWRAGTRSVNRRRPPSNHSEAFSAAKYHGTGERDLADPDQRSHNKCSKERLSTDSPPIDEGLPNGQEVVGHERPACMASCRARHHAER
jgi:hypothetical protein